MTLCPRCGSTEIVPRAKIEDRGDYNVAGNLQVAVDRDPEAWIFKQPVHSTLYASICGSCGYAELYVSNPRTIYDAYRATRGDER